MCSLFFRFGTEVWGWLKACSTLINHRQINIAIISRLLRHSSDVLLEELAAVGVRLVSPMPMTEREVEALVQIMLGVKNMSHNSSSTEIILSKTSRPRIEKLGHRIDGEVLVISGSTGALRALYQLLRAIEINDERAIVNYHRFLMYDEQIRQDKRRKRGKEEGGDDSESFLPRCFLDAFRLLDIPFHRIGVSEIEAWVVYTFGRAIPNGLRFSIWGRKDLDPYSRRG